MVPESIREFFVASAGVAGALIGLLFVAMSLVTDRLARAERESQVSRITAVAALTAFTNALVVSLFALIPGQKIGPTAVAVSAAGITFITATLLSLVRLRQVRWGVVRGVLFLIMLAVVFVLQLIQGLQIIAQPRNAGDVNTIAVLVVVCFLIGIARAWALIGAPSIGIGKELTALVRDRRGGTHDPGQDQTP